MSNVSAPHSFSSNHLSPQDRLTRGCQLANVQYKQGLDRLKFGFHVEFENTKFFELLAETKEEAKLLHEPVLLNFGDDANFLVYPNGRKGGYNFHLSCADVNIFVSTRKDYMHTPNVWVDIGSSSCWHPGYREVIYSLRNLIEKVWKGKVRANGVSEVHLCVDAIGVDINTVENLDKYDYWVTRANKFNSYYDRGQFTGITLKEVNEQQQPNDLNYVETGAMIGKGDLVLRVYDKVNEIESSGSKQSLFASVWGTEEFNESPVTRIEFQLRKPTLRQFRIKTLQELFQKFSALWDYLTKDWSRLTSTIVDRKNRHQDRSTTSPFWQDIQRVDWQTNTAVMRKKPLPLKDPIQLLEQGFGCLLNVAIIEGCRSATSDEVLSYLHAALDRHVNILAHRTDDLGTTTLLRRKFDQKFCEVWPYGEVCDVHGPNERDAEVGIINSYQFDLSEYEINSNLEVDFS